MSESGPFDGDERAPDGGQKGRHDPTLRERMARVETTQHHLAETQDDIAEAQEEILEGIDGLREEMPDAERLDELEDVTALNRRYVAILKWAGSGLGLLGGSSLLVWLLQVMV